MSGFSALAGGVFHRSDAAEDGHADLRQLVADIAARSLTERQGARRLPELFDAALWGHLEDAGLTRLTTAPDLTANPSHAAVVLNGLARYAAAGPFAETDLMAAWLAGVAGLQVPDTGPLTIAQTQGKLIGGRVTGTANRVPWSGAARTVVLTAPSRGGLLVGVIEVTNPIPGHNLGGEPRETFSFDVAASGFREVPSRIAAELMRRGAWTRCVQIMGALDAATEMTVAHTRERVQFGRPLSGFQSVQHTLAAMAGDVERGRVTAALAVAAADEHGFDDERTDYAIALAKVTLGAVVERVSTAAHQLHGAIGVTLEHQLHLATLRARSWISEYGSTGHHARRLGRKTLAAAQSGEGAWNSLIGIDLRQWGGD